MTGMARFSNLSSGRLRVCRSCIAEEKEKERIPIWRRAAVLPGILHCPWHEERYLDLCGGCFSGFGKSTAIRSLTDSCLCGNPLRLIVPALSSSAENASIRVSKSLQFALEGGLSRLTQDEIRTAYKIRARQHGIMNAAGVANVKAMKTLLQETGTAELARSLCLGAGPQDLFGRCLRGKDFNRNPIINALIQCALFPHEGELVGFIEQRCAGSQPAGLEQTENVKRRLAIVKQRILAIRMERPGITRVELHAQIHSRDMQLLIEHDLPWLDGEFPKSLFNELWRFRQKASAAPRESDERMVKYVNKRWNELLSAPDLPRITQRRLLDGCPGESSFHRQRDQKPKTVALLARLTESADEHSIRVMKAWLPHIPSPEDICHGARLALIRKWKKER